MFRFDQARLIRHNRILAANGIDPSGELSTCSRPSGISIKPQLRILRDAHGCQSHHPSLRRAFQLLNGGLLCSMYLPDMHVSYLMFLAPLCSLLYRYSSFSFVLWVFMFRCCSCFGCISHVPSIHHLPAFLTISIVYLLSGVVIRSLLGQSPQSSCVAYGFLVTNVGPEAVSP